MKKAASQKSHRLTGTSAKTAAAIKKLESDAEKLEKKKVKIATKAAGIVKKMQDQLERLEALKQKVEFLNFKVFLLGIFWYFPPPPASVFDPKKKP